MSAYNGDKSRFHRLRKSKAARRVIIRALAAKVKNTGDANAPAESEPKRG